MAGSGFENNLLFAINADFSNAANPSIANGLATDNQVWMGDTAGNVNGSHALVKTITAGTGINFTGSTATTFKINSTAATTDLHTARFIVSPGGTPDGANYTTIGAALGFAIAAGGNQTIFIQPGTYTENLSVPANINMSAYICDSTTPNVTIIGKISCSDAGTRSFSGIRFQTNNDNILAITGTVATIVNFNNCYFKVAHNVAALSNTSTSNSSEIDLNYCLGVLNSATASFFAITRGSLKAYWTFIDNNTNSTTASTLSNGSNIVFNHSLMSYSITSSNTSSVACKHTILRNGGGNATILTIGGTGVNNINFCIVESGTASAISIGTGATAIITNTQIDSTNTNAITGLGTINYSNLTFTASSSTINTTTTVGLYDDLGKYVARKQPYFAAYLNTTVPNVTGDGTVYTIIFDTLIKDNNGDFNLGTSTFTAPVTGIYHFDLGVLLGGGTSITAASTRIVVAGTSAATYDRGCGVSSGTTSVSGQNSITIPMTATDTAVFQVQSTDTGAKVDDVNGISGALRRTYVMGYLAN